MSPRCSRRKFTVIAREECVAKRHFTGKWVIQGKQNLGFFCRKMCFDATLLGKISSVYPQISDLRRRNQEGGLRLNANCSLVPASLFTLPCLNVPVLSLFHFMILIFPPSSYTSSLQSSSAGFLPYENTAETSELSTKESFLPYLLPIFYTKIN